MDDKEGVEGGIRKLVSNVAIHPQYSLAMNGSAYDLAVVAVDSPFKLVPKKLTTVGFAKVDTFTEKGQYINCQIAGMF